MEMTPLTLVVLLAFGLLIAVCLTAWTAVSFDRDSSGARAPVRARREDPVLVPARPRGNDKVRRDRGPVTADKGASHSGGSWRSVSGRTVTARRISGAERDAANIEREAAHTERKADRVERKADRVEGDSSRPLSGGTQKGRAAIGKEQEQDEDAFERFLRARPDDIDLG